MNVSNNPIDVASNATSQDTCKEIALIVEGHAHQMDIWYALIAISQDTLLGTAIRETTEGRPYGATGVPTPSEPFRC